MENIVLEKRELKGKKCKKLLREGIVPCVIYNIKKESKLCQIGKGEAEKLLRGVTSATMLDVEYSGEKMKTLVKDVDTNPRTDAIRHISFFEIDENVELSFEIPFVLTGIAPAVKNNLGVIIQTTNSVSVKCRSKDLVPQIEVDISHLEEAGSSILIKDITIPEGLKLVNKEDAETYTIATITELQREVVVEETEEVEGEEGETEETEGATQETTEEKKE